MTDLRDELAADVAAIGRTLEERIAEALNTTPAELGARWLGVALTLDEVAAERYLGVVRQRLGVPIGTLRRQLHEAQRQQGLRRGPGRPRTRDRRGTPDAETRMVPGLPEIEWRKEESHIAVDACRGALRAAFDPMNPVMAMSGALYVSKARSPTTPIEVRALKDCEAKGQQWIGLGVGISRVSKDMLRGILERTVNLFVEVPDEEEDGRTIRQRIAIPEIILSTMSADNEAYMPPFAGIQGSPLVLRDGSVVDVAGYYEPLGLLFDRKLGIEVPPDTSQVDAGRALDWLRHVWLAEFPFETEADRDVAILAALTAVQKSLLKEFPGFLAQAPSQSSGKTTLMKMVSWTVVGAELPASSWCYDEAEMVKTIFSILLSGAPMGLFDNLQQGAGVESNALALAMTSETYTQRLLSKSEVASVPSNCLWFLTGNNVTLKGDFATRFIATRLNAGVESPEARAFARKDLKVWCQEHRREALRHLLTVLAGGLRSPAAQEGKRLGRFGEWEDLVYLPARWAGLSDIGPLMEREKAKSAVEDNLAILMEAWHACFGNDFKEMKEVQAFLAAHSVREPGEIELHRGFGDDRTHPIAPGQEAATELREAIQNGTALMRIPCWKQRLSRFFKSNEGAVRNGKVVVRAEQASKTIGVRWAVVAS